MTEERIAELEKLCEAATPEPQLTRYSHGGGRSFVETPPLKDQFGRSLGSGTDRELIADYYTEVDREFYHATRTALPEALAEIRHLQEENRQLTGVGSQLLDVHKQVLNELMKFRRLLWLRHGCPSAALYGDDGKMDCNACLIDFKGISADHIESIWRRMAERAMPK